MSHLVALTLSLVGFIALACGMKRQQRDLFGRALQSGSTRMLRLTGAVALLGALNFLVVQKGWGLGLVMFSGHTSIAAGIVVCVLIGHTRIHAKKLLHQKHREVQQPVANSSER